jgi:hypothetical protein
MQAAGRTQECLVCRKGEEVTAGYCGVGGPERTAEDYPNGLTGCGLD